jgi:gamma-glutamyltranspeptidase / glutathione hydrolase
MAPAIRAAEEGFVVDAHYVRSMNEKEAIPWYKADPSRQKRLSFVWKRFLREGNVKVGDRIRLPEQADALRLIARDGADAFYKGEIAAAIVDAIERDGGVITRTDLAGYQLREVEPLTVGTKDITLLAMPPPSSGGIVIAQMLLPYFFFVTSPGKSAEQLWQTIVFDTATESWSNPASIHIQIEKLKDSFSDRAQWLADPEFVDVPLKKLLSDEYLELQAKRIDHEHTRSSEQYGLVEQLPDDSGTSHWSVIDANGNAVACTETINTIFGSCLVVEKYGFALNNQMDDFTTRRGKPNAFKLIQSDRNRPQPGKRPLSSMSPTIVLDRDGRPMIVAGASGGPRIITGTLQAILNVLVRDMPAGEAVKAPRIHHQWQPDILYAEKGALSPEAADELKKRGHKIEPYNAIGNVQLIRRAKDGKGLDAACDPRKGGRPAGF